MATTRSPRPRVGAPEPSSPASSIPASRHEAFHSWASGANNQLEAVGAGNTPRQDDLRSLGNRLGHDVIEETDARLAQFGEILPHIVEARHEQQKARVAKHGKDTNPAYAKGARARLISLEDAVNEIHSYGRFDTSISGMTRNLQGALDEGIHHALAASRFSGNMEVPDGPFFYPYHAGAYSDISRGHGFQYNQDRATGLLLASTPFSAGSTPVSELRGAAGLSKLHAEQHNLGITLDEKAAAGLTAAGRVINKNAPEISPGNYTLGQLHPHHRAAVIRHIRDLHYGGSSKIDESGNEIPAEKVDHDNLNLMKDVRYSKQWADVAPHTEALVAGASTSGKGVISQGFSIMDDPSKWSDPSTSGAWKVPSYSTITALHMGDYHNLAKALHHMIGASIHGDRWWDANPGAADHVAKYINHPAMTLPINTNDIHHARAAAGVPSSLSSAVGEMVRPENILTIPKDLRHLDRISDAPSRSGSKVLRKDLGYYGMEHATQAVSMPFRLNGASHEVPLHAKQALIWLIQQSRNDSTVKSALASGEKSLIHSAVRYDPTLSLNPTGVLPHELLR